MGHARDILLVLLIWLQKLLLLRVLLIVLILVSILLLRPLLILLELAVVISWLGLHKGGLLHVLLARLHWHHSWLVCHLVRLLILFDDNGS